MAIAALSAANADGFFNTIRPHQDLVAEVLAHSDSRQLPVPWRPAADSPAMAELAVEADWTPPGERAPVESAYGKAALLMLAAEDHLDSLSGLYRPPDAVSVFTPSVILRALLETLGRVRWLIDPHIGVKRRVGRNMTETLHTGHHRRKSFTGEDRKAYDRDFDRESLTAWGQAKKYEVAKDKDGSWYVGEPRLGTAKAIGRLFSGSARESAPGTIFRATSAVSHASIHGILSRVELESTGGGAGSRSMATIGTNDAVAAENLAVALYAYVLVAVERRKLLGWASPEWDATVDRVGRLVMKSFEPVDGHRRPTSGLYLP
ncbi:hypothetical protein KSP35_01825 [Aquihabitans sp. G128]|uniref:hypothetical protein n=1 Tax=Aquihabitans sp. G128 TaxID=2849779 RepID=UPI001C238C08|nr:hypothetical protein [Aquihabitans sp. G128]QXC61612.1 hypothetical protein KSP35_01825 [Aquihabitans sp. G128]